MKKENTIKPFILFALLLVAVGIICFFGIQGIRASFQDTFSGWAWSENIGWVSLNNIDPNFQQNYGVTINTDNSISGYAWLGPSQNTVTAGGGWLVFGKTIQNVVGLGAIHTKPGGNPGDSLLLNPNSNPDGGPLFANLDPATGEISGWARFVSLWDYGHNVMNRDDWGWVKLKGVSASGDIYGLQLDSNARKIDGYAWSGGGTDTTNTYIKEAGYGWIHFSGVGLESALLTGLVCDDANGNNACDPSEKRIDGALLVSGTGGYRSFSQGSPQEGVYVFPNIQLNDATGSFSSDFTATFKGCQPKTISNITVTTLNKVVNQDFPLQCFGIQSGNEEISGSVFEDVNGNGVYDSQGDVALSGALIYTNSGDTAFSDTAGNYTLYKLAGNPQTYSLSVTVPGFTLTNQTKPNPITAPDVDVNFIMEKGPDYQTKAHLPWVQTLQGDAHARGTVQPTVKPPFGYANATYMITAGGTIDRYVSYAKEYSNDVDVRKQDWVVEGYGGPLPDSLYGGVDFNALKNQATDIIPVSQETADNFSGTGIFYRNGDLEITGGEFSEGARVILVDGNLTISGDMAYMEGTFSKDKLPSTAFIVKGSVFFDNEVRHSVGSFYVGEGISDTSPTANDPSILNRRLINEGLMIATIFDFKRQITHDGQDAQYIDPVEPQPSFSGQSIDNSYSDPEIMGGGNVIHYDPVEFESPSVLVFYDGRIIINTPPGLEEVSSGLPRVWKEVPAQ